MRSLTRNLTKSHAAMIKSSVSDRFLPVTNDRLGEVRWAAMVSEYRALPP